MAAVPCSVELHRSSSTQLEWYFHRKHAHYKVQMYNNKKKALKNLMDRKKENPLREGGWIISYEWALALITTRETITIKMQLIFVSAIQHKELAFTIPSSSGTERSKQNGMSKFQTFNK